MKPSRNGRLEEAIAILLQNQASFLAQLSETDRRMAEMDRINAERFGRIEATLLEHSRVLAEHSRILAEHTRILGELTQMVQTLADTIRERIGFKTPG